MYSNISNIKTIGLLICFMIIISPSLSWKSCTMTVGLPDPECCGRPYQGTIDRTVGGEPTSLHEYPWLALLVYPPFCITKGAGSLITSRLVLTAAHCTMNKPPVAVRLGEYDTQHDGPDCLISNNKLRCTDGALTIQIAFIHKHPRFLKNVGTPEKYDIAILELTKTAPVTDFIKPICLPQSDVTLSSITNLTFHAAGWGTMRQYQHPSVPDKHIDIVSNIKQHVKLPYVSLEKCNRNNLDDSQMCAGGEEGKDSCTGDSGGPLMYSSDKWIFEIVGIVSYGDEHCAQEDIYGVYTKVIAYKDFIFKVVKRAELRASNEEIRKNMRERFDKNYCAVKDCKNQ